MSLFTKKEIPGKGKGVFATEFIPAGTLIWKLTESKKYTREEWEKMPEEIKKDAYPDSEGNFVAAQGNPDSFWADKFLKDEIELFEPELIILFGSKPVDFLFGKGKLKDRVNTIMEYEGITTICSLHPSRDWNMFRREEYEFTQTWVLIRSKIDIE